MRPSLTLEDGAATVLTRDHHIDMAGRTYGVVNEAPDGGGMRTVGAIAHEYDARQRRTTGRREDGTIWHYGYNERSEVTSADKRTDNGSLVPALNFGYSYDGIGNRTAASFGRGSGLASITYEPNALNQYDDITNPGRADILVRSASAVSMTANSQAVDVTSQGDIYAGEVAVSSHPNGEWVDVAVDGNPVGSRWIPPATETPVYDDDGNLRFDGRWECRWDGENRLLEVSTLQNAITAGAPDIVVSYTYDWRSRRMGRTEVRESTTTRTRYLYDDWNVAAGFEADASSNLTPQATYTWSLDLSGSPQGAGGVGGLLSVELVDGGGSSLYLPSYDANGNIIAWTDDSGELKQRRDYDPFGNPVIVENVSMTANHAARLTYGFSTKPRDLATGWYYYGFRWLDPQRGGWINRDPVGEIGGANVYSLVKNAPCSEVDPLGLQELVGTDSNAAIPPPPEAETSIPPTPSTYEPKPCDDFPEFSEWEARYLELKGTPCDGEETTANPELTARYALFTSSSDESDVLISYSPKLEGPHGDLAKYWIGTCFRHSPPGPTNHPDGNHDSAGRVSPQPNDPNPTIVQGRGKWYGEGLPTEVTARLLVLSCEERSSGDKCFNLYEYQSKYVVTSYGTYYTGKKRSGTVREIGKK